MNSNLLRQVPIEQVASNVVVQAGFEVERLPASAKWSFVTRNVAEDDISHAAMLPEHTPAPGDLILARVTKIAQQTRLQLRSERRSQLYPEDKVVVAFGNRYAPDQYEAEVPRDLDSCHLVAAGGIAAKALSKHCKLKWPTALRPEGYCIGFDGRVVNLRDYCLPESPLPSAQPTPVIAVLGTSMNSGKTTTAGALVKGFTAAGYRVAAIKVTGTGSGNDLWTYADCGAELILDFTDAGHPSTYKVPQAEIQACFHRLLASVDANPAIDMAVVEVADGLLHGETAELVASPLFKQRVDHVLFAAGEALGAVAGVERLKALDIRPIAISGLLSASRLASSEAELETGISVLTKARLEAAQIADLLIR